MKDEKKRGRRRNTKAFWVSFFCTLCVLFLAAALLETDYQCNRIGFGGGSSVLERIGGEDWRNLLLYAEIFDIL